MENKYYTPDIADLFVGYECQIKSLPNSLPSSWVNHTIGGNRVFITDDWYNIHNWISYNNSLENYLRTLFLTKEQIEAEGWEYNANYEAIPSGDPFELGFLKEMPDNLTQYLAYYNPEKQSLRIEKIYDCSVGGWIYIGQCPSINEFRRLLKWLGV